MLWYFAGFAGAFATAVLLMVWYSRFMFQKIYGEMREQVDSLVSGNMPPEWDERLVKRLLRCRTEAARATAEAKHKKFVEHRVMDSILFMKRTSMVESEAERAAVLERLELFRREYRLPQ